LRGEEAVAGHDLIAGSYHRSKSTNAFAAVEAARMVRIAEPNGVVEVEDESANTTTKECQLPTGQEFTLDDDGVGVTEVRADAQTIAERRREGAEFEGVASVFDRRPERGEAIATTDVFGRLHQRDQMHTPSSVTTPTI